MAKKVSDLSEIQLLQQIAEMLDKLILVTALQGRTKEEQIKHLSSKGYSNSEMGAMLAIPKGTVDGMRASLSKPGAAKSKRKTMASVEENNGGRHE